MMTDAGPAPHEPNITGLKQEIDEDKNSSNAATADTALVSLSREPSITSMEPEIDDDDEGLSDADVPRELTIASLDLGKDDEDFADGIACVQAYWEQASQMDTNTQEQMRHLIISKQFAHTLSSRQSISKHRLYRGAMGKDEMNTWPIFLMLKAMYKDLPHSYLRKVRAKGFITNPEDHTDDYMAAYHDTIRPRIFDTDTRTGREYREMWPKLKNTPTIYRKSRAKNDKQSNETETVAPQVSTSSGKKRPAVDSTTETPTERSSTREENFEFDSVLMQMTLPGVPSSASNKVDVEKELADLKEEMAKMRQQTHMFMKVTADVVTSMKTEIEDLKEEIKGLKK
ncbi:hypothetical protein M431DRAFT_8995 [Trichoderma harzianum CBS 226.95]|uniref:Uncharacterized protein n=1 Tax=Trichoderma harzianum CBS 226.95 TaxID=983964 RepID=A0A2T4A1L9_TRIHA|nr:hypothetical protein M431DRAFT_8995 [Trichoderma harzianum CBS 226.95]PTB50960.1 hypothetical protein M431DRAFT_8995 [Trichoderma harzianum CBS 226.95]